MLLSSTTGHRPAGRRNRRLGRSRLDLERVSRRPHGCTDDMHTLVALVAATGSSTPVVAASAVACEVR